jgi:hypothetical protein
MRPRRVSVYRIRSTLENATLRLLAFLGRRTERLQKALELAKHLHGIAVTIYLCTQHQHLTSAQRQRRRPHYTGLETGLVQLSTAPSPRTGSASQHQIPASTTTAKPRGWRDDHSGERGDPARDTSQGKARLHLAQHVHVRVAHDADVLVVYPEACAASLLGVVAALRQPLGDLLRLRWRVREVVDLSRHGVLPPAHDTLQDDLVGHLSEKTEPFAPSTEQKHTRLRTVGCWQRNVDRIALISLSTRLMRSAQPPHVALAGGCRGTGEHARPTAQPAPAGSPPPPDPRTATGFADTCAAQRPPWRVSNHVSSVVAPAALAPVSLAWWSRAATPCQTRMSMPRSNEDSPVQQPAFSTIRRLQPLLHQGDGHLLGWQMVERSAY